MSIVQGPALIGCQKQINSNEPMDAGFSKIDRGDYEGAIAYFEDLSSRDSRPQVKVALASAYAGKAGTKIEGFWSFVQTMKKAPVTNESARTYPFYIQNKQNIANIEPFLPAPTVENLNTVFQMMAALDIYRTRLLTIPYVDRSHRPDLQKAIQVLSEIPDRGGRVYRAALTAAYLRAELDDGFDVWSSIQSRINEAYRNPIESVSIFCTPVTGNFVAWLGQKFSYVDSTAADLIFSFPSEEASFTAFEMPLSSLQQKIPVMQSSLVPSQCHE